MGHNYTHKLLKSYKYHEIFHFSNTKTENRSLASLAFQNEVITNLGKF